MRSPRRKAPREDGIKITSLRTHSGVKQSRPSVYDITYVKSSKSETDSAIAVKMRVMRGNCHEASKSVRALYVLRANGG